MNFGRVLAAFIVLAVPAFGTEYTLELKPANTKIQWTLGDVLHTVHGTFTAKRGTIDFDTTTGKASGQVVVDVTSGNSGNSARDKKMHGEVLESAKYPEATFVADRAEGAFTVPGASTLKMHGTLKIHGAAHEVILDVQSTATPDQIEATMTFDIPFVTWGMKDPSTFLLKTEKVVHVSIAASGTLQKR